MQPSEWAGNVGETWAEEWARTDRTFAPVDAALVAAAADRVAGWAKSRILDVGCGAGQTSLSLAEALPDADVTGIDLSPALILAATERATGALPRMGIVSSSLAGPLRCRFEQGDATVWSGERDFDLLVSRHGVMFFDDPVAVFGHLRTLAMPGAPLVFSCFRSPHENLWASGLAHLMAASGDCHAPGPFAFADEAHVAAILGSAGWHDMSAVALDYDYVAGYGADPVADAVDFFGRIGPIARALRDLVGDTRAALASALVEFVRDHLDHDRIVFPAAAWIWSARA